MRFATFKQLRLDTASVIRDAGESDSVIVTRRGKPVAVVLPVTEESLEDVLKAAAGARLARAFQKSQEAAKRAGLYKMSTAAIDAVVRKARAARRRG